MSELTELTTLVINGQEFVTVNHLISEFIAFSTYWTGTDEDDGYLDFNMNNTVDDVIAFLQDQMKRNDLAKELKRKFIKRRFSWAFDQ